jgi:NhaP-type Na+/H+ or K+/H+ antiporter
MSHTIIQYTCLLIVIMFVVMLAQKIKIAYPILLVVAGLILGFVPGLKGIQIEPELIFLIFLPP